MSDESPRFYCNKMEDIHAKYKRYDFGEVTTAETQEFYTNGFVETEIFDLDLGVTLRAMICRSEG